MIGIREDIESSVEPAPEPAPWKGHVPRLFSSKGWLYAGGALEHRPAQAAMAYAVADEFSRNRPLFVEAGTGVGKSLAYLLPGIMRAVDEKRPFIVSTHTISLQEQLERKDLPLCRKIFSETPELARYADFKSAVLVGRGNYLCGCRLRKALEEKSDLFGSADSVELQRIADWAQTTGTGLRHELSPQPSQQVWESVNAESAVCGARNCSAQTCPYQRAKARVASASIIIVNHSLLFALLQAGASGNRDEAEGILLPDDFMVLDEAHTVPEVATDHLGLSLSSYGLTRLLHGLYHPEKGRGLLKKIGLPRERDAIGEALVAAELFFNDIVSGPLAKAQLVRIREPDTIPASLDAPLRKIVHCLESVASRLDDGPGRDEVKDQQRRVANWRTGLLQFCAGPDNDEVHWLELSGKRNPVVYLRTAPLDVAPKLRELLFTRGTSVVVTSATLGAGRDPAPFAASLGADGARCERLDSPFDFERQMTVNIADDMPEPDAKSRRMNLDWLCDMVEWCIGRVPGGTLCLFTSHADLREVSGRIAGAVKRQRRRLLVQDGETSRTTLTDTFRDAGNAVLMGTSSFWTGVDVPGDSLSQVIVVRLPFDFPNHPVSEARSEWIRERGGNPFAELQLPAALRTFRQGVGRLIRSSTDRGVVTVLDSRILTKPYGRQFIDCLPTRVHHRFNAKNRDRTFRA